jgi:hypothetical protein
MRGSWFRPLLCVGLAALLVAVFLPALWLSAASGQGPYTLSGTLWSMLGGAAGALGVVGAVVAYYCGLRPVYVLPVVFGGAPIFNTVFAMSGLNWRSESGPLFLAGLILVIAGSALALVLAKRGEGQTVVTSTAAPHRATDEPRGAVPEKGTGTFRSEDSAK